MNVTLRTRSKLRIARLLYHLVTPFYGKEKRIIRRGGLKFEVDISEGLDLSLFLFGNFQKHVTENKFIDLEEDSVILDIGANVGIMSLNFARKAPQGKVFAFEPTRYALKKLKRNVNLNPELASVIEPVNSFLSSYEKKREDIKAYASWRIDKKVGQDQHQIHGGTSMPTEGVPTMTVDEFANENGIDRIDFIKIDTDGHEYDVLLGAEYSIQRLRPQIIFELGDYVMEERGISFQDYADYFNRLNYFLSNASNNAPINKSNFTSIIPRLGTIDVLALPVENLEQA